MPGRPFSWFTCAGLDGALKGTRGSPLTVYRFILTCTCYVSMYVDYISLFSQVQHLLVHSQFFLGITYPVCRIHLPPDRRKASVVSWPSGHGWTRILWQSFSGVKMMVLHISCACFLSKKQDMFMTYTNCFMFTEIEMNCSPCVSHWFQYLYAHT